MNYRSLKKRIEALRVQIKPDPLIVFAWSIPEGIFKEMTAQEFSEHGFGLPKVVSGENVDDLDLLLDKMLEQVMNEKGDDESESEEG